MKKIRRSILPVVMLFCMVFGTFHVSAADDYHQLLGTVVDGSLLTDGTESDGFAYPWARGSLLSSGSGYISIAGKRKVTVSGSTSAYRTVDRVTVTLHLQKLKNGSWVHVATLGPRNAYNTSYVSNGKTYSVEGGYFYRVTGGHTAIKGGTPESITSFTDGVWVS